jgi:signal peptidase I
MMRRDWIAGVLSFLTPGIGHLYAGVPRRGAVAWLASHVLGMIALTAVVVWRGPWGFWVYVVALVGIAGGVAYDAIGVVRRRQGVGPSRWFNRLPVIVLAWGATLLASALWAVLMDSRVADRIRVPTDTMAPAILAGDRMFVDPRLGSPVRRGDVVVYKLWETRYIKRVLGLPGDTLAMRAGTLAIDGRPLVEPYALHAGEGETPDPRFDWQRRHLASSDHAGYAPTLATWGPLVVPPGAYFVLGDNRGQSVDSRYAGFLADTAILGRPLTVFFSRDPVGGTVRWGRVGIAIGDR